MEGGSVLECRRTMDTSGLPIDLLPAAIGERLGVFLGSDEVVTHVVPALGAIIVLTDRRIIVIREGGASRPRTGLRDWALEAPLMIRVGLVRHGTGSLLIQRDRSVTNVFVGREHWREALRLIAAVRRRIRPEDGAAG